MNDLADFGCLPDKNSPRIQISKIAFHKLKHQVRVRNLIGKVRDDSEPIRECFRVSNLKNNGWDNCKEVARPGGDETLQSRACNKEDQAKRQQGTEESTD